MTATMIPTDERRAILDALDRWIRQRPGLEYGNYGDPCAYGAEVRRISKQLRVARELLAVVERKPSITGEHLREGFRAYSGRLSWRAEGEPCDICKGVGKLQRGWDGPRDLECYRCKGTGTNAASGLDYCTGQYWPTEYRAAACAVLASVLWHYYSANLPEPTGKGTTFDDTGAPIFDYDLYRVYGKGGLRANDAIRRAARMDAGLSRAAMEWMN